MAPRPRELSPERSARDLFGSEMRRYREAAGMSLESLATVARYSKSALARFETAETMIPEDLPDRLDEAFGTGGIFRKLYALARKEIHPDQFRRLMDIESRARLIEEYSGQLVPGLLQTEDYARALFTLHYPRATSDEIEELVAARLGRQAALRADPAPDFFAILDEAVLLRPFGGPAVMRAQLQSLLERTLTPTTVIQVLPFSQGGHAMAGGSVKLMTLPNGTQMVWEEGSVVGTMIEEKNAVVARSRTYDLLRAHALPPQETAAMIRSVMEALKP